MKDFDAPENEASGGDFLSEPGTYHFAVQAIHEERMSSGKSIDGFSVQLEVLAGTVADQVKKTTEQAFFDGKLSDKDDGVFRRQIQMAFLIAAEVLNRNQLGKKGLQIDLEKAVGQQIILTLIKQENSRFLGVDGAAVYHVDDPAARSFPRCKESLGIIPKEYRKGEAYFKKTKKAATKETAPVASLSQQQIDAL